jgi:hypothetical protein
LWLDRAGGDPEPSGAVCKPRIRKPRPLPVTALQGVAIFALWQIGRFSTHEIAHVVKRRESEIANLLGKIIDGKARPVLTVIAGGK